MYFWACSITKTWRCLVLFWQTKGVPQTARNEFKPTLSNLAKSSEYLFFIVGFGHTHSSRRVPVHNCCGSLGTTCVRQLPVSWFCLGKEVYITILESLLKAKNRLFSKEPKIHQYVFVCSFVVAFIGFSLVLFHSGRTLLTSNMMVFSSASDFCVCHILFKYK